jgi:Holliday junction resolvase RusA-like endonuclease
MRAKPTPRPRVTRYGFAYYPKEYAKYQRDLSNAFKKSGVKIKKPDTAIALQIMFWFKKPKKSKSLFIRGDLDNFIKGVMDQLKCIIGDDKRVIGIIASKKYAENDCIDIIIEEDV